MYSNSCSSALEAIQDYGPGRQPQSYLSHERDLNIRSAYKNIKEEIPSYSPGISESPISYDRITPNDSSSNKLLSNLNLRTVEEEDEFLYGDSSSLPEAPKSVKKETVNRANQKCDAGWSDEEELFEEPSTKQESVWKVQRMEPKKLSLSIRGEKSSFEGNIFKKAASEHVFSPQHSPSPKLDTKRINRQLTEYENFAGKQFPFAAEINSDKSKYHAAAEILKKSNTRMETVESYNKSNKLTDFENAAKSSEKEKIESKADKTSTKSQRQLPKAFSQKDLDNVKNYLKGSPQKRLYPEEYDHESKQSRSETSRHLSPSESKYPRHENTRNDSARHRSPVRDYRHRSPHSRHRSPVKDLRTRFPHHSSYYSHDVRRRSRSPGRRSRDKSPETSRHYRRSPGSYRSRDRSKSPGSYRSRDRSRSPGSYRSREKSRSPGSYRSREKSRSPSSRDRLYEKSSRRRDRSPENYPSLKKKREDRDSAESFCSLSLSSESDSSDSSVRSCHTDEKKRTYLKSSAANEDKRKKDTTKPEDKLLNPSTKTNDASTSFLTEDVSKTLADIFNRQNQPPETNISSEIFKPSNTEEQDKIDNVNNIFKILEQSQIISEVLGQHQQTSSFALAAPSNTNSVATSKILPVSNPQLLPMSNPQLFTMSNPPLPTMPYPQSYSYPAMAPGPIPYPPPQFFPAVASPPVCPPPVVPPPPVIPPVVPPVVPPTSSMFSHDPAVQAESTVKTRFRPPQTLRQISTNPNVDPPKIPNHPQNSKPSVEKTPGELKETGSARKDESPKLKEAEQNSKKYKDEIEKYKKIKHDRSITRLQVNNCSSDIVKMRAMLVETWPKNAKVSHSDKILHTKCKNLVNNCSDKLNQTMEKAKNLDRDLRKIMEKLPKSLQQELSKFRSEDYKEKDNSTERYSCLDPGSHYCNECGANFKNIAGVLEHIQISQHQKNVEEEDSTKDSKEKPKKDGVEKCTFKYVKGIEFLKPMTGFHCAICKETIDSSCTEEHIKSHEHYVNYKKYSNLHPLYESYVVLKRYIQLSVVARVKKVKEEEEKKKQSENLKKDVLVEEKEKESNDDRDKGKVEDDKETSPYEKADGKAKSKTTLKYNFIGKAPNFKKTLEPKVVKPKPWYKRESILNQKDDDDDNKSPESLDIKAKISRLGEKTFKPQFKKPTEGSAPSARPVKEDSPKRSLRATCLSKEESDKKKSISKSNSEKSVCIKSVPLPPKESTIPQTDDPIVNRAIKNILGHSSPPRESISLQEISLPKTTDVETVNSSAQLPSNTKEDKQPIPMDIDNSQDSKSVNKIVTEEEKDLYILGINKDDLKPLVIPVPPPSYSGNAASYLPSNNSAYDYSFADPTVLNYVRNTPPPNYPHSNTNSGQTGTSYSNIQGQIMHPYSNQTNMLPINRYPNASNTPIISYPNTRVPPPLPPYANTHNAMPYMPQYSNANNMTFSNNMPLHSRANQFLNKNVPSPPANNFNVNLSASNTVQSPTKVNKKQVSEIKPVARTLVTIVPNVNQNKSVKSNDSKGQKPENKANSSENLTDKGNDAKKEHNSVEKQGSKNNESKEVLSQDAKELPDNKESCTENEQSIKVKNNESEVLSKDAKELPASKDTESAEKEQSIKGKNNESKVSSKDVKDLPDSKNTESTEKEQSIQVKNNENEVLSKDAKEVPDTKDTESTEKEQSIKGKNNESEVSSKDAKDLPDSKDTESMEKEQSIKVKNNESEVLSKDAKELPDSKDTERGIKLKNNESEVSSKDAKDLPDSKDTESTEKEKRIKVKNNESEVLSKDAKDLPGSKDTESMEKKQSIEMKKSVCISVQKTESCDTSIEMESLEMSSKDEETMEIDNFKCGKISEFAAPTLDKYQMVDSESNQKSQEMPEQNQTFDESMDVEDKGLSTKIDQQSVRNNEKVGVLNEASEELSDDSSNTEQQNDSNNEKVGVLEVISEELMDDSINLEQQNIENKESISNYNQKNIDLDYPKISDLHKTDNETNKTDNLDSICVLEAPVITSHEKTDASNELIKICKEMENNDESMEISDQDLGSKSEQQSVCNAEKTICDNSHLKEFSNEHNICDTTIEKTLTEQSPENSLAEKNDDDKTPIISLTITQNNEFREPEKTQNTDEKMEIDDVNFGLNPEQHDAQIRIKVCDFNQAKHIPEQIEICDSPVTETSTEQSSEDSSNNKVMSSDVVKISTSTIKKDCGFSEKCQEIEKNPNVDESEVISDKNSGFKPDNIGNRENASCDPSQVKDVNEKPEVCSTFDKGTSEENIEIIEIIDDDSDFERDAYDSLNKEKAICDRDEVEVISEKSEIRNRFGEGASDENIEIIEIIDDDDDFKPDEHNIGNNEKTICDLNQVEDISEKPEICNRFGEGVSDKNKEINKNSEFRTDKIMEVDYKNQSIKEEFTTVTNQMDKITAFKSNKIIKQEKENTVDQVPVDQNDAFISEKPTPPTATNADNETSKANALECMGDQESRAQFGESSTDDPNDSNTTATFADISSSLDKLQKVVTEVNTKVELQEKKEKMNTQGKIGNLEFNPALVKQEKLDSETEGKIGSFEFNQEPVIQNTENACETFPAISVKKEKDSDNEEKISNVELNQEPEKKCDDSDTDEYEDKEE